MVTTFPNKKEIEGTSLKRNQEVGQDVTDPRYHRDNHKMRRWMMIKRHYSAQVREKILDFDSSYKGRSTCQLLKSYAVLKSCSNPLILSFGPKIMETLPGIAIPFSRYSYYDYFVGGHDAMDCEKVANRLWNDDGLKVVLDYSVESQMDAESCDAIANEVANSIRTSSRINQNLNVDVCKFGVVKLTGIVDIKALEKLNVIIEASSKDSKYSNLIPDSIKSDYSISPDRALSHNRTDIEPLTSKDIEAIELLLIRMKNIVKTCDEVDLPLLIDAEHTYYQAAIDYIAMYLQLSMESKKPRIFNTYQMYLEDALPRLQHDMQFVHDRGLKFGSKLVRGAYIDHETARCKSLGLPLPFNKSKPLTDDAYNNAVYHCLDHIDNTEVFIATHNENTIEITAERMIELGIARHDSRITFAQLYGMGDSLSLALINEGFNVAKYLPYGPISEVMPYLTRRIQENGSMLGGNAIEVRRIAQELATRTPWRPFSGAQISPGR